MATIPAQQHRSGPDSGRGYVLKNLSSGVLQPMAIKTSLNESYFELGRMSNKIGSADYTGHDIQPSATCPSPLNKVPEKIMAIRDKI